MINSQLVNPDAAHRLYELIEREQLPEDVRSTLAMALNGDLARQQLMFQAMIDTWPRLQKCVSEVKRAIRKLPWVISPKTRRGEEPTETAQNKADFVEDNIWECFPRAEYNEKGFEGLLDEIVFAYFAGHNVTEILWDRKNDGSILPRAYKIVPPRFYGYPSESGDEDILQFDPEGGLGGYQYVPFPKHKFIISINQSHNGHPTIAAPFRALTGFWLAATFGLKWFLNFSQLFGIPFRWAEYSDERSKDTVFEMLQSIGSSGVGVFPSGTTMHFLEAQKSAENLPQRMLIEMADKQAEIFILGQSLTSDSGDNGSRALGEVHSDVKNEVVFGVADFVCEIINRQLIPSILELNYGNKDEAPTYLAKFEKPKDEKAMAERDKILLDSGVPFSKTYLLERHGLPTPEGDDIFRREDQPNGVQGDPATGYSIPSETKAISAASAQKNDASEKVNELVDAVLEGLTGVSAAWLAPVKPYFLRLAAMAESGKVSDDAFVDALKKASDEMPELFDVLDSQALQDALEKAMGTAIAEGAAEVIETQ